MRDDETAPCDVNLIKAFSVHDYKCAESYWEENYALNLVSSKQQLFHNWKSQLAAQTIWTGLPMSTTCPFGYKKLLAMVIPRLLKTHNNTVSASQARQWIKAKITAQAASDGWLSTITLNAGHGTAHIRRKKDIQTTV